MLRFKTHVLFLGLALTAFVVAGCQRAKVSSPTPEPIVVTQAPPTPVVRVLATPKPQNRVQAQVQPGKTFTLNLNLAGQAQKIFYNGDGCGDTELSFAFNLQGVPPLRELSMVYQLSGPQGQKSGRVIFQNQGGNRFRLVLSTTDLDLRVLANQGGELLFAFEAVAMDGATARYPQGGQWLKATIEPCQPSGQAKQGGPKQGGQQGHPQGGLQGAHQGGQQGAAASNNNNNNSGGNDPAVLNTGPQYDPCLTAPESPQCTGAVLDIGPEQPVITSIGDSSSTDSGTGPAVLDTGEPAVIETPTVDCNIYPYSPECTTITNPQP